MRHHEMWKQAAAMSLAALFVLSPALAMAQEKSTSQAHATKAAAGEKERRRGGPQEGIKVHGHWTIQVFNKDGTVARHMEFENALTQSGVGILMSVLERTASLGGWAIQISDSNPNDHLCFDSSLASVPCVITSPFYQTIIPGPPKNYFFNLDYPAGPAQNSAIVLAGSFTASPVQNNGVTLVQINSVATLIEICYPTNKIIGNLSSPLASCPAAANPNFQTFTAAQLPTPITVEPGRIVQVTVSLSFS